MIVSKKDGELKSEINKIFGPFRNIHEGEIAVLFATGPSLNNYIPIQKETINFGVNSIVMKPDVKLDYYFFGDKSLPEDKYNYFKFIRSAKTEKFCHVLLDGEHLKSQISINESKDLDALPYEMTLNLSFQKDISTHRVVNHSIVFAALQFILYTGIIKVYLVGCDVNEIRSFAQIEFIPNLHRGLIEYWKAFKKFVTLEYPEAEIISVNPVNLKGLFIDEYQ